MAWNRRTLARTTAALSLAGLLAVSLSHANLARRLAYAVERGRLDAEFEHIDRLNLDEVATLEQVSHGFSVIAEAVKPSVVNVRTVKTNAALAEEWQKLFGNTEIPIQPISGTGSGVIIDSDGHIVTNHHVVDGAEVIHVTLDDGREYRASFIGSDHMTDIAVIKIQADNLHPARLGDSDLLQAGHLVLAMGSPFSLAHSVSHGIVSALGRTDVNVDIDYQNWIQTDASINPGNSGGPLINTRGEVVGISVAIATHSGGYQGVGFAIPANAIAHIADILKSGRPIVRGYLGVEIVQVDPKIASAYELETPGGVFIRYVGRDSPAAKGGLLPEDIILEIEDEPIKSRERLQEYVANSPPDTSLRFVVWRNGNRKTLNITVGTQPEDFSSIGSIRQLDLTQAEEGNNAEKPAQQTPQSNETIEPSSDDGEDRVEFDRVGLVVKTLTRNLARQHNVRSRVKHGALIVKVRPASEAYDANLRRGFVITEANGLPITKVADLSDVLTPANLAKGVRLKLERRDETLYAVLQVR
ncbi:MAG: trypsin-like peptidase domain-containing protein [Planctomycetota bacterium]